MQGLLEGKVAVITGAGSGVGRAAVKLWAEHGAKIIAADINLPSAEESVQLAGAPQGQIKAVQCNVADPDSVDAAVALAVSTFGRLDVIYNNAGITVNPVPGVGLRKLIDLPHEEMRRVEEVNINGVIFGAQAAIRQFDAQAENGQGSGGVIVNTASVAGMIGYGGVLYGATKGAVVQLTRGLAIEVAEKNIRVNSVCFLSKAGGVTSEMPFVFATALFRESTSFGLPTSTATRNGPLSPTPKPSVVRSYAWRVSVEVGRALSSSWPSFMSKTGHAITASSRTAPTTAITGCRATPSAHRCQPWVLWSAEVSCGSGTLSRSYTSSGMFFRVKVVGIPALHQWLQFGVVLVSGQGSDDRLTPGSPSPRHESKQPPL